MTPSEHRDFHTGNLTIGLLTLLFGVGIAVALVSKGWSPRTYYVVPAIVFALIGLHVNSYRGEGSREHPLFFLFWMLAWPIAAVVFIVTSGKELER